MMPGTGGGHSSCTYLPSHIEAMAAAMHTYHQSQGADTAVPQSSWQLEATAPAGTV